MLVFVIFKAPSRHPGKKGRAARLPGATAFLPLRAGRDTPRRVSRVRAISRKIAVLLF
jgi:hypothetical protein